MLYDKYLDKFLKHRINPEIGIDALALERFTFSDFKRIGKILSDHKLTVTLHGPFIDLSAGSTDPAVATVTRNRFEQLLNLVPLFKPKSVVCHAGYDWKRYGYFKTQWIENCLDTWSWLATCINNKGSRLMLENVYEKHPNDIRVVLEPLKNFGVGFCLDCGHMSAFGDANIKDWLDSLGSYIAQLHLHDNHGSKDEHLAIGSGSIDFRFLFNYLKLNNNSLPIITLEPHQEKDLWPSLAYLTKIWPW
jgi:sugar phosphate isomerase/epimerase